MLEDSSTDTEIIRRVLKKSFTETEIRVAMTEQTFISDLNEFDPDVILADNSLPQFDASEALRITRNRSGYTPFIMVTGSVSEEFAAGIIKLGADDYILKDRLTRLPNAIIAAIKQRGIERENREAQIKLSESEIKYRSLFENSPLPIFVFDLNSFAFLDVNEAAVEHYGYTKEEFLSMDFTAIRPGEDVTNFISQRLINGIDYKETGVWKHIRKGGEIMIVKVFSHDIIFNSVPARIVLAENITDRIKAEEDLRAMEQEILVQKIQEQKKISRAIIHAQEKERNYIGQELHDNVNQILAGTKIYLSMAGKANEEMKDLVKYPVELIDSSINEIRSLSSRHVTPLKDLNLKEQVESLTEVLRKSLINVHLDYDLPEQRIDDDMKLNIYRIIQEQVTNILKHASPANVYLGFKSDNNLIHVHIADDGKGFDPANKRNGIGISNLLNRIEAFNGEMKIESSPGNGCKIDVVIPFNIRN